VDQFRIVGETHAVLWLPIHAWKTAAQKSLLLYGRHFLTDCLSQSHSASGAISRRHSKPLRFRLSFGGCEVHRRLLLREYAHLKSEESFWITQYM
jgi:hypothetical protein